MGTLIILGAAFLGVITASHRRLLGAWIFFANQAFAVYLAVFLAPVLADLLRSSLASAPDHAPYWVPAFMFVLYVLLMLGAYKFTDAVLQKSLEEYNFPAFADRIGSIVFSALSGAVLCAFLMLGICMMPFSQNLPGDRTAMASSARGTILTLVRTVNGFSFQSISPEAKKTLDGLTAYQPPAETDRTKQDSPKENKPRKKTEPTRT